MKVLVVGGVAGGASVAARLRRLNEDAKIIIFEKGPHVSYSNCSLPFYLDGEVETSDKLVLMNPKEFIEKYNIEVRVMNEVIKVNPDKKNIEVTNLENGNTYIEDYDKLVLAPGANAIYPDLPGINGDHVFVVKNVTDVVAIKEYISKNNVKDVVVVGAGFIGMEVTEALTNAGLQVHLVEAGSQVMNNLDDDFAQILHKQLYDHQVDLHLDERIVAIEKTHLVTNKNPVIKADVVIMAIGVKPNVELAKDAGIEIGELGGISVNKNMQTNQPDIYAVGDAIEVVNYFSKKASLLSMAFPAQKQARVAADHMMNRYNEYQEYLATSSLRLFDYNIASTGINEKMASRLGFNYQIAYTISSDKVSIIPTANYMHFKLIFEVPSGRILGAQAIGKGDVISRIDVVATLIKFNAKVSDVFNLELAYSPHYSTAKDLLLQTALVANNLLNNEFKQVKVSEVRDLVLNNAFIIDVREKDEFEQGHIINAINIPMSKVRLNLDIIPKDQPVYLHCRSSQRSYNVIRMLQNKGYTNVYNISGSYLGLSFHEYYKDKTSGRESILTDYNFE